MYRLAGWLVFTIFAGFWLLIFTIVFACAKKGGVLRILAMIISIGGGIASGFVGWQIGPITGWIIMILGPILGILATWTSIATESSSTIRQREQARQDTEQRFVESLRVMKERELQEAKISALTIIHDKDISDWGRYQRTMTTLRNAINTENDNREELSLLLKNLEALDKDHQY